MPRTRAIKPKINFSKGLFTEASPLNFPENFFEDGDNIEVDINGQARRRKGLNAETAYSLSSTITESNFLNYETSEHIWKAVGGDGALNFYVLRIGSILHFYNNNESPRSAFKYPFTFDLTPYLATGYTDATSIPIFTASGLKRLFVAGYGFEPFYISYDSVNGTVSGTLANIKVRDFKDIEDGIAIDEQPTVYSETHEYNMRNRGWVSSGGNVADPFDAYFTAKSKYPSKNKSWWAGKDSSSNFDSTLLDKFFTGTTSAPLGHYILNPFYKDRSTVSGVANIAIEKETKRPNAIAPFASRIFWALGNRVYFNRVINSETDIGICYQKFDPTSEDVSDLLDDDGGEIPILEASNIISLAPFNNSLVVYASNGVWAISGADGIFKATGYSVTKLSNVAITSPRSLVQAESVHFFWSDEGIHAVSTEQVTQLPVVTNITVDVIDTKYKGITEYARTVSQGVYDLYNKKITWIYPEDDTEPTNSVLDYTKYITLNLKSRAWTVGTFPKLSQVSSYPAVVGISPVSSIVRYTSTANVVDASGNQVTDSEGNNVVVLRDKAEQGDSIGLKYLVFIKDGSNVQYTFCDITEDTFYDFKFADGTGVDATAYIEIGDEQLGDVMTYKQSPYIMTYFERTEQNFVLQNDGTYEFDFPSGCLLTGKWDWSNIQGSNRWTPQIQCYRFLRPYLVDPNNLTFNYGQDVIVTKNKLRGKGRTLNLRFDSQAGKDFRLYGYSFIVDSNQSV